MHATSVARWGMDINDGSEDESPPASAEKENVGSDLRDFHSQSSGTAAAGWPSGTAAWVSRKSRFFPVLTGGYRDKPASDKPGLVRVRYVSVKDKHRNIDDVQPSRLRSWDDANARAVAARQAPSVNCSAALVAIVQRVADGEDADAVLSATREQQQQQPLQLSSSSSVRLPSPVPSNSGDATSGPTQAVQVQVGALVLLKKSVYSKYRDADLRVRVLRVDVSSSIFDAVPAHKQQYDKRSYSSWKLEGAPLSSIERLVPMPGPSAADSGGKGGKRPLQEPVASSAARADNERLAEAAEAEEAAAAAEAALPKARRGTGKGTPHICRRCGQPRRGHLCTNPKQTAEEARVVEQARQGAAGRKRGRDGVASAATRRSSVGLGAGEAGASRPGSSGGADCADQSEEEVKEEEEEEVKEEGGSVHVRGSGPTPPPQPGQQPRASASSSAAKEASPGSAGTAEVEAEEVEADEAEEAEAEEAEAEEEAAGEVGIVAAVTATVAVAAAAVPARAPTITDALAVAVPVAVTAAVPSLTTMMTQLRQQLDLESSAQLPQVENAAAGLGFTPDPSRNLGQRIRALWQALVL